MAKKTETHYDMLGVEPHVTSAEIKRAYRKLAKDFHPDVGQLMQSAENVNQATERMMQINEAYATLIDKAKRAQYDTAIGLYHARRAMRLSQSLAQEDEAREVYLRKVFHPCRKRISRILNMYTQQLRNLSLDIYDDALLAQFVAYVDDLEAALRDGATALAHEPMPNSLAAAGQMLQYSIAHAADGLEEMRRFCLNYDYDHLTMAQNLVRIAQDLFRQSLKLTRYG